MKINIHDLNTAELSTSRYFYEVDFMVGTSEEDFGVGSYEHHGLKGCHTDIRTVIHTIDIKEIRKYNNDGELVTELEFEDYDDVISMLMTELEDFEL